MMISNIIHILEAETDIPQDEKSVYIGTTFAGFNNRMTYSLNTVSTVENFIFDNSYFSEDSPRLMIRQNSISFISSDIVSKEKNTAFKTSCNSVRTCNIPSFYRIMGEIYQIYDISGK